MRKRVHRALALLLAVGTLLLTPTLEAFALSWEGSSAGGGGEGGFATTKGFSIRYADVGTNCLGYRFSVVDKAGNTRNGAVIDIFRNTTYGNKQYTAAYKYATKYNKKQLIINQNNGFSTSSTTTNCYKETSMGFAQTLPDPDGMKSWQNDGRNLNPILLKLGINNISGLKNGDKVLVEPLYDVRLQTVYHSVTATEIAIYGKWLLGANSDGGSSGNSDTWGFISAYTNRYYPNALYTPDGQGLWTGAASLTKRATFYDIINKGYGVGIAYTETKPDISPALNVKYVDIWKGSIANRGYAFGSSNGSSLGNYSYINNYPTVGDSLFYGVYFPPETQNIYVRQSVRLQGGNWTSRNVYSNSNTWYDVALPPQR